MRGTLYNRLSATPSLFHDKVERTKFFSTSRWQSVSQLSGCWICNSKKIIERSGKTPSIANSTFGRGKNNLSASFKIQALN
mmetsp:Transcript_2978/g.3973  ORF Transcript_2978/g.3973 Transcript_2978/m.3973 type:complete len:81 (-) Transcript_2978:88-330(-)